MHILAFDLARKCGVAYGDERCEKPRSFSFPLYSEGVKEGYYFGAGKLGEFLNEWIQVNVVDAIVCEKFMDPAAQDNQAAIISGLIYQGAILGVAKNYDIPVHMVPVASARKDFCGRSTAHPPRKPGTPHLTQRERERRREDTKKMVWDRCAQIGYVDRGDTPDYDRSDALCIFSWAIGHIARAPRALMLSSPAW